MFLPASNALSCSDGPSFQDLQDVPRRSWNAGLDRGNADCCVPGCGSLEEAMTRSARGRVDRGAATLRYRAVTCAQYQVGQDQHHPGGYGNRQRVRGAHHGR